MTQEPTHEWFDDHQVKTGIKWLEQNQNYDGGWGIFLGAESNVGATAYAIRALKLVLPKWPDYTERIQQATSWMLSQRNIDGGWGTRHDAPSSVFPTSQVLQTVDRSIESGLAISHEITELLMTWQNDDGGWGLTPGAVSAVHDTCHAAFSLLVCEYQYKPWVARAVDWICNAQREDYGWSLKGQQSSPSLAVHTAEILVNFKQEHVREVLEKAMRFICSSQKGDGGWTTHDENYNATFLTPVTLVKCGLPFDGDLIQRGIIWIRNSQLADEGWPSEKYIDKGDTIFTCLAIEALIAILTGDFRGMHM